MGFSQQLCQLHNKVPTLGFIIYLVDVIICYAKQVLQIQQQSKGIGNTGLDPQTEIVDWEGMTKKGVGDVDKRVLGNNPKG